MLHRRPRVVLALGAMTLLTVSGWVAPAGGAAAASPQTHATSAPACSLRDLSVTVAGGSAASNQEAMLLRFRNKGRAACSLYGYPEVVTRRPGAASTAIHHLNIYNGGWTGAGPPRVELDHGQSASAVVGAGAIPSGDLTNACFHERYASVQVSISGSRGRVTFSARIPQEGMFLPSCTKVAVTPFAPGVGWFLPDVPTTTTLPRQGGYRGLENFCAVQPLTGTIFYDGTGGTLTHVLTVTVGGLPPDEEIDVDWSNDHVRAPVIASFTTDATGTAVPPSVHVSRLGEVRGVELILTAAGVPNPVLGRLEPC